MLFADIEISEAALAVVVTVVASLAATIAMLWRIQVTLSAERIADLQRQRDQLLTVLLEHELRHAIPRSVPRDAIPGNGNQRT